MNAVDLWNRFRTYLNVNPSVGVTVDISLMNFPADYFERMAGPIGQAFASMAELEAGGIANPDEGRMVGHYWLRDPGRAPTPEIAQEIEDTVAQIKDFADKVHSGVVQPETGGRFRNLLVIGIGGSALGPEFVADALTTRGDRMRVFFIDNTDPDGIDRVFGLIGTGLSETLTVVISKSGGTKETRNGMLEAAEAYNRIGRNFGRHAVAITGRGSDLDKVAVAEGWLTRFPMWDWIGGRTSELSAVGLAPAALQGFDIDALLRGARAMDQVTRTPDARQNPAALLALMWYHAGNGRGTKDMVVLPYKDRLLLFSRYLQQLVMESLGKATDREGRVVHQGIAVYGNKGSTDQHAYVQQLRDGLNNFFVTFIEVLRDRHGLSIDVEPGVTAGDFLDGFLLGTRQALWENGRESITLTVDEVHAETVGKLIALYERAVGLYGFLININAYHQPGVEAGKRAAAGVIAVQRRIVEFLAAQRGTAYTLDQIVAEAALGDQIETAYKVLQHLAANPDHHVEKLPGDTPWDAGYRVSR